MTTLREGLNRRLTSVSCNRVKIKRRGDAVESTEISIEPLPERLSRVREKTLSSFMARPCSLSMLAACKES